MQGNAHDNYLNSYTAIMLRNVLEDYFGSIKDERDGDYILDRPNALEYTNFAFRTPSADGQRCNSPQDSVT